MEESSSASCSNGSNILYSSFLICLLACSSFALGYLQNSGSKKTFVVRILSLNGKSPNQIKIFKIKKNVQDSQTEVRSIHDLDEGIREIGAHQHRSWMLKAALLLFVLAILVLILFNFNPALWEQIKHRMGPYVTSESEPPMSPIEMIPNVPEDDQNSLLDLEEPISEAEPPVELDPEESKKSWLGSEILDWLLHPIRLETQFRLHLMEI